MKNSVKSKEKENAVRWKPIEFKKKKKKKKPARLKSRKGSLGKN